EALTGTISFPGDVMTSAMARLDRYPVVPASVPDGLGGILRAMTRRNRHERPPLPRVVAAFLDWVVDELVRRRGPGADGSEA
ncbi:UNVERIFIED_CONTAM: hypothetical protein NY603_37530, partial [Bacteroidetes bacterium 56_B9]